MTKITNNSVVLTNEQMEKNVTLLDSIVDGIRSEYDKMNYTETQITKKIKETIKTKLTADSNGNLVTKENQSSTNLTRARLINTIKATAKKIIEKFDACTDYDSMWKHTDESGLIIKADPKVTKAWKGVKSVVTNSLPLNPNNPLSTLLLPVTLPVITMLSPIVVLGSVASAITGTEVGEVKLSTFGENLKYLNADSEIKKTQQLLAKKRTEMNSRMTKPHWYSQGF